MTYKAQLVVRARSKDGAAIIETVKEMANEQGTTYSEMAVKLLGRGLNADEVDATVAVDDASEQEDEENTDDPEPAVATSDDDFEEPKDDSPPHPKAPLPPEEAGPSVDPDLPPEEILAHYLERRDERGERAAGRILVDFFAEAGPGEGGELKKLLQKEYSTEDYEALMEPIKETDEYSTYTERAIFGEPSPYSQAN